MLEELSKEPLEEIAGLNGAHLATLRGLTVDDAALAQIIAARRARRGYPPLQGAQAAPLNPNQGGQGQPPPQ